MANTAESGRPPSRGGPHRRPAVYAALDLGTNNCRLLVAQRSGDGYRVIDSFSRIVRLGEGLGATGQLSEAAMARAIDALAMCRDKLRRNQVSRVRCIATQACRAASNGPAFLQRVREKTGLTLETITPKEEAKLALLGSHDLVDDTQDFALVVDIGGGSTELCWVDARAAARRGVSGCAKRPPILGWASFPVGVVTLSEANPGSGREWYEALVAKVVDLMRRDEAAERFGPLFAAGRGHLLGTSGTVTSLAAVHLGLRKYHRAAVDGAWVTREGILRARDRLIDCSPEQRAQEPCIGPERSDLVLSGCAILDAVWELWPAERLRAADRGLREGVLLSLMHTESGGRSGKNGKRRGRSRRGGSGGASPFSSLGPETAK